MKNQKHSQQDKTIQDIIDDVSREPIGDKFVMDMDKTADNIQKDKILAMNKEELENLALMKQALKSVLFGEQK